MIFFKFFIYIFLKRCWDCVLLWSQTQEMFNFQFFPLLQNNIFFSSLSILINKRDIIYSFDSLSQPNSISVGIGTALLIFYAYLLGLAGVCQSSGTNILFYIIKNEVMIMFFFSTMLSKFFDNIFFLYFKLLFLP